MPKTDDAPTTGQLHDPGQDELLAAVVRNAPYFIGVCDATWRAVFVNEAGRRMVGLGEEEVPTLSVEDFFQPEDRPIIRDLALPTLERTGSWEGEYRFLHFAGGPNPLVNWRAFALRGRNGGFLGAATFTTDVTARREAEVRLWQSEARLKAAVELVGLSCYRWTPATGELEWDARLRAIWGFPEDAQVNHDAWLQGIHPDDRDLVAAAANRSIDPDGDGVYAIEYRVIGLGGGERWVSVRAQTFFEGRRPLQQIGAVQDITERKHANEQLRRSEAYLSAIVQQLPIGVGVFDRGGRLALGNTVLHGYVVDELPSQSAENRKRWRVCGPDGSEVPPEDYPGARALRGEITMPVIDAQYILPDGRHVWTRVGAAPLRDESGAVSGVIVTYQDIDQEKRVEASLRESEERFRSFAEHSTNVLWIFDVEQDALEYLSPAFEQVWGRPREGMLNRPEAWAGTMHPDDRPGARHTLEQILQGGAALTHEFRIVRPDGSVRWIRDTCFAIHADGVHRVGGIAQDVTRASEALVYLVDTDRITRARHSLLLRGANYHVQEFEGPRPFLEVAPALAAGCVLLGLQPSEPAATISLLQQLKARQIGLPVVVVGAPADEIELAVRIMKAGAVECLVASEDGGPLLGAVAAALAELRDAAARDTAVEVTRKQMAHMSAREREVLQGLLTGATNKEMARVLGISPRTVEIHRAHVMERIGARTLPEAVLLAAAAGLKPSWPPADGEPPQRSRVEAP